MTKTLEAVTEIVKILREEGSMNKAKLMNKVGATRRTFYRTLKALREAGVVLEEGGICYWHEFLETRVYRSDFEAEQALKHSKNVALSLKDRLYGRRYHLEGDLMPELKYKTSALMHLRIGYVNVYRVFEEAEAIRHRINQRRSELKKRIMAKLPSIKTESKIELEINPDNMAEIISEDIISVLRKRDSFFFNNLKIKDGIVESGRYTLGKNFHEKDAFEVLTNFIKEEEASIANRKVCRKIVNIENQHYELSQMFEKEIETLITLVENGTPLKGKCDYCPKVKIKTS